MSPPGRPKGEYRSAQREGTPLSPPGRPKGEYRSAQREGTPLSATGEAQARRARRRAIARLAIVRFCVAASLACSVASASAQSIFKCKSADGRTTYSATACTGDGATLPLVTPGQPAKAPANSAAAHAAPSTGAPASSDDTAAPPPTFRAPLPKQCDNKGPLQYVVARLDSAATPDDIRGFLADERFRLLRCEFTRFTAEERRERDAAMRGVEARDPVRRRAAVLRVEALYDRYLNPAERTARARQR